MLQFLFALVIFEVGSHIYAQASLDLNLPIYASCVDAMTRGIPSFPAFYWLKWGLMNFLPGLALNCDLLNFTS
jgi:hypothetical protein